MHLTKVDFPSFYTPRCHVDTDHEGDALQHLKLTIFPFQHENGSTLVSARRGLVTTREGHMPPGKRHADPKARIQVSKEMQHGLPEKTRIFYFRD